MARLIICLYRLLADLLVLPLALGLKEHPNFKGTLRRRLALDLPSVPPERPVIWVHAASVGEVKAVGALLDEIKVRRTEVYIVLTAMTATGRSVAGDVKAVDLVWPFPFDLRWVMRRYFRQLKPELLLIAETEIWPNLLLAASKSAVPVVFANARMTAGSFRSYHRLRFVMRHILKDVRALAIAEADADRFRALGAASVRVMGNLKLDALAAAAPEQRPAVRRAMGLPAGRPVFIAGSVREGEEGWVVAAIAQVRAQIPDLYAVVAPRHPEGIAVVSDLARRSGLRICLRSSMAADADVMVVDTMGELFRLYGAADVAFVGGSLAELGGQNVLEPAAWGIPVIHGPHMDNFLWALEALGHNTVRIETPDELGTCLADILKRPDGYRIGAAAARGALEKQRGITGRYAEVVTGLIR